MPSPLAPDPIRVQSRFDVYSVPIEIVWRLAFYLYHYPIRVMNPSIGAISKWKYLLLLKRWWIGRNIAFILDQT